MGLCLIPDVILDYQHRPDTALLGTDDRREICIEDVSTLDGVHLLSMHLFVLCV